MIRKGQIKRINEKISKLIKNKIYFKIGVQSTTARRINCKKKYLTRTYITAKKFSEQQFINVSNLFNTIIMINSKVV